MVCWNKQKICFARGENDEKYTVLYIRIIQQDCQGREENSCHGGEVGRVCNGESEGGHESVSPQRSW